LATFQLTEKLHSICYLFTVLNSRLLFYAICRRLCLSHQLISTLSPPVTVNLGLWRWSSSSFTYTVSRWTIMSNISVLVTGHWVEKQLSQNTDTYTWTTALSGSL